MAKKRGTVSPLGNTVGSIEAQHNASRENLDSLASQLSNELKKTGEDTAKYLAEHFGLDSVGQQHIWNLASRATATFSELNLTYEQVRDNTFVQFDVNGRDQTALTPASLTDLESLSLQQFYPAVGHESDGKINILDGSRRRAWFLLQEGKIESFRLLVTKDDISFADAKALAKQLQTAKEHNLREIGMQCLALKQSNDSLTQTDIAKALNISQAAVSKSIKAASVPADLVSLFPVVNELSHADYSILFSVTQSLEKPILLSDFIEKIKEKSGIIQLEYPTNEQKDPILQLIRNEMKALQSKQEKDKSIVTKIAEFKGKGVFARKKVKGRNFSYEFGRLSKNIQDELDAAIAKVLEGVEGE
jgi:ParB family transcriptional regulator, chromosome partitioning protein